jgi:N-acetyl-1-D-myo-inositol-2-amino-2-deoxy-alpha-D-glucopyranoside deacetylase
LDITPWLEAKVAAVLAHRSEVQRGGLPGVVANLSPAAREALLGAEHFIELAPVRSASPRRAWQLT